MDHLLYYTVGLTKGHLSELSLSCLVAYPHSHIYGVFRGLGTTFRDRAGGGWRHGGAPDVLRIHLPQRKRPERCEALLQRQTRRNGRPVLLSISALGLRAGR